MLRSSNMGDQAPTSNGDEIARWAHQLGLAASALFGHHDSQTSGNHFALLDGRRGSFACSLVDARDVSISESRNWQWSADLAHHVFISQNEVVVRSGSENIGRRFDRASVEVHLDEFHSFLDRPNRSVLPDIVPFLVDEFLQVWATFPTGEPNGLRALAAFLLGLQTVSESDARIMEDATWRRTQANSLGLDASLIEDLDHSVIQRAISIEARTPVGLNLLPKLVLRHAAGRLFQEAHAHLEAQMGLFGDATVQTIPSISPTGAYFTPVPIARLLAESAFEAWTTLPDNLTIADFACGSAVFLCEALRELERRGYRGQVHLIGRDISPEAVMMAQVAIATTIHDLNQMRVKVDVEQLDVLKLETWPKADVILMNPPFRSWEHMSNEERSWVREAIQETHFGRPDLSVGFVEHSLRCLKRNGVLATLIPAGVLASEGLSKWRASLAERSQPRLVAVLGEHGLFRHAFVNVGILVLEDQSTVKPVDFERQLSVAWASPDAGAASEAIRALRRLVYFPQERSYKGAANRSWTVTQTSIEAWSERVSWLPGPGVLGSLLDAIKKRITTRVEDLFAVHQGIRTGAKGVFILSTEELWRLPRKEQSYFRAVVDTPSFEDGKIIPKNYLFVPDSSWKTEEEVADAVPRFFENKLRPSKEVLTTRKGIKSELWWQLTRVRGWSFEGRPRLVSKRFGLSPAFGIDQSGTLAVVQANAWVPIKNALGSSITDLESLLKAYWWLLNSRVMVALFREYCPNVAGGQLDLEKKYVKHVPLPNLVSRLFEDPTLQSQSIELQLQFPSDLPPIAERDRFAAAAYGTVLDEWPIG
jgi:adenine-specific DNA-methyltransferase